ncbi:MAG: carboxypeptidase-like regulatory domain-containing protein, partial [Acidobacteriota bacterium]|nr:carboxypeptidase-like regulatory domain-containing protein [Acidobacteriota bacterium]
MTRLVLLAMVLAAFDVAPAVAQIEQGRLTGIVSDAQGALLPGVTVTATSPSLIGTRVAVTEGDGKFLFPALPSGTYALTFELKGFRQV